MLDLDKNPEPREVSEHFLAVTGRALLTRDFSLFAPCFALPQEMDTFDGRRVMETEADLRTTFEAVCDHFSRLGVTDIVRHCVQGTRKGPDRIETLHETRLLVGTELIQTPFPVLTRYERQGGVWRIVASSYAIPDNPAHNAALLTAGRPG